MSDSQEYIASVLAKHSWNLIGLSAPGKLGSIKPNIPLTVSYSFLANKLIVFLLSALMTGCAAELPILTLIDHGSGMDPDISPAPDFRIELFEDGKVHYHGLKSVNVIWRPLWANHAGAGAENGRFI